MTLPALEADPACPPAALPALSTGHTTQTTLAGMPASGPVQADPIPEATRAERPSRGALRVRRSSIAAIGPATWDALAARNPSATPFSAWAFQRAWWDGYGSTAHEETLVVEDGTAGVDALPVAIVPLMHRHEVEPGDAAGRSTIRHGNDPAMTPVAPTAKAMFFGASYHADYATILGAPLDMPAVAAAVVAHLAAGAAPADDHPTPWDVVDLRRLRCGDAAADALADAFRATAPDRGWTVLREREDVCPVLTIPAGLDFEGYLDTLDKKARHEIRRKIRRAEAAGDVVLAPSADPLADLDEFIDLHQRRWGPDGLFPPTPGGQASRLFLRRLFEGSEPDGPVRLSFLSVAGRRIAAGIHLDDGRTFAYYNAGVDPDARDLSPGVVMVARYIAAAIAAGRGRFDFLRGDEGYKYEWGALDEPIERILVTRSGGAGTTAR